MVAGFQCPVAVGAGGVHLGQRRGDRQVVVEGGGEAFGPGGTSHRTDAGPYAVQELLDAGVGLHGVLQSVLGEFEHRAVMGTAQVVAQLGGPNPLQHCGNGEHIAQRFTHLLTAHGDPAVVQPEPGEAVAAARAWAISFS